MQRPSVGKQSIWGSRSPFSPFLSLQEMKAQLYAAVEQSPSAELVDPEVLTRYFAKFDEQFFHYCDSELAKINTFYSGLLEIGYCRYF